MIRVLQTPLRVLQAQSNEFHWRLLHYIAFNQITKIEDLRPTRNAIAQEVAS